MKTAHLTKAGKKDRDAGLNYVLTICNGPSLRDALSVAYCSDKASARRLAFAEAAQPWNF